MKTSSWCQKGWDRCSTVLALWFDWREKEAFFKKKAIVSIKMYTHCNSCKIKKDFLEKHYKPQKYTVNYFCLRQINNRSWATKKKINLSQLLLMLGYPWRSSEMACWLFWREWRVGYNHLPTQILKSSNPVSLLEVFSCKWHEWFSSQPVLHISHCMQSLWASPGTGDCDSVSAQALLSAIQVTADPSPGAAIFQDFTRV